MTAIDLYRINRFMKSFGGYSEEELANFYPFEYEIYYYMLSVELEEKNKNEK